MIFSIVKLQALPSNKLRILEALRQAMSAVHQASICGRGTLLGAVVLTALLGHTVRSQADEALPGGFTPEQINEMINNPLGELWLLFGQSDFAIYDGVFQESCRLKFKVMPPFSPQFQVVSFPG
jgi:hypothetical protein